MYIVLSACFLLLAFMIWKEITRENTARRPLRVLASLLAAGGFACMALPLSVKKPVTVDRNTVAILLTDGYNADSVKNFMQQFQLKPVVYSIAHDAKTSVLIDPVPVYSQDSLRHIMASYSAVHVFGNGFGKETIDSLQDAAFEFHPSVPAAGFQSIHWIKKLRQGEQLMVQGSFYNPGSSPVKILFTGLQAHLDSSSIAPASTGGFALSAIPKFAGKALYGITALSGKDTVELEQLPVLVDTSSAIKILVLASSPDFENKFLKDWLAKHGYEVDVRTVITTNKYNRLSVNAAGQNSAAITPALLQRFDVLVSDPASLTSLSSAELHTVTSQVSSNGLGLIVRADSLLPRSFYTGYFPLSQSTDSLQQQLSLYTNDVVSDTAKWQAAQPMYIRTSSATQPLVSGSQENTVVSSALYGTGKIVLSTVNNSYSWLLAGNEKMYESFWSLLIKKAVRKKTENDNWSYSPALPLANEPVALMLETDAPAVPQYNISGMAVSYKQNALMPFQWQVVYWPAHGWQTAGGAIPYPWFVYDKNSWKNMRANQHLLLTKNYLSTHDRREKQPGKQPGMVSVPIPKIYFFIIFMIGAVYLWIEKKLM